MMNALYSAATGMMAQQTSMDVVANNLANATTTGYKRDRMDLVDLEYQAFRLPTGTDGQVGLGAAPGQIAKEHAQGS
ncbi:MAG: flagellar basal body protein, partial [Chloroflexota bacterium]|nr:flagellar basal body protein [Chloroflexota bacterium]